jgi:hypothetical protein
MWFSTAPAGVTHERDLTLINIQRPWRSLSVVLWTSFAIAGCPCQEDHQARKRWAMRDLFFERQLRIVSD